MKISIKSMLVAGALVSCTYAVQAADKMMSTKMDSKMSMSKMPMNNMKAKNAQMLIQTLSEEKTEINNLSAQQTKFRQMGGAENMKIASMFGVWIKEHKAGGPMFEKLIKQNGGDPKKAHILKPPALGTKEKMLAATMMDHQNAVKTSKMRAGMTNDSMVKMAMQKRVALATKHLNQMKPYDHMMGKMGKM